MKTWRIRVSGRVQGVGFRWFTRQVAQSMGLQGWVRNRRDETVEILVSGDEAQLQQFEAEIRGGPRLSLVEEVKITCDTATTSEGFEITATV